MKKLMVLILMSVAILIGDPAIAANLVCQEDWESTSVGPLSEIDPADDISECARPFWGTDLSDTGGVYDSVGNPDKAAVAHIGPYTNDTSYSEPKFRFDNMFSGSYEIYLKFDLRINSDLGTSNATREIYNFKIIRITDYSDAGAASSDEWHPQINFQPSSSAYSLYTWTQGAANSEYYFNRATTKQENHLMDNDWHTIEIYMHIGSEVVTDKDDPDCDGIVRIWEDDVLILEDTSVPFRSLSGEGQGINSMAFIRHAKALGAPVGDMDGHLYFDNIEVWDGMPDYSSDMPIQCNWR